LYEKEAVFYCLVAGRCGDLFMKVFWHRWTGRLSEKDKYEITSWAFSYFMKSNLSVSDAVENAIRKVKPEKVDGSGRLKLSETEVMELQLRVKNML
jgi:hypothetical protein